MLKRMFSLIIISIVMLSFGACSSLYTKEVLLVTDYTDETHRNLHGDVPEIADYTQLKNAIISMVNGHVTDQKFKFTDYSDKLQSDLFQVCWEVRTESALGSYAVDYISHDLDRIVSYYEATVYITYKRTAAEISNLGYISGASQLSEAIDPVLERLQDGLALRLTSSSVTEEMVQAAVLSAYYKNPLSCIFAPIAQVSIHPSAGLHRIIEINFDYGANLSELRNLKSALNDKLNLITDKISGGTQSQIALELLNAVNSACTYDPAGLLRAAKPILNAAYGTSAYGALVEGFGDSQGMATAFSALCHNLGIESLVVSGSFDKLPHWWNIVKLDDAYYHVDVSATDTMGIGGSFMLNDSQMRENYWWNIEDYPDCDTYKNASRS